MVFSATYIFWQWKKTQLCLHNLETVFANLGQTGIMPSLKRNACHLNAKLVSTWLMSGWSLAVFAGLWS